MIFAEMEYQDDYWTFHEELKSFLSRHFSEVQSGLQSDSWFWILDAGEKVAIDTFTSMKHQVKATRPGPHVQRVIETLGKEFRLMIYESPEPEEHEEF